MFSFSAVHELEQLFASKKADRAFLKRLVAELKHRKTQRAKDLLVKASVAERRLGLSDLVGNLRSEVRQANDQSQGNRPETPSIPVPEPPVTPRQPSPRPSPQPTQRIPIDISGLSEPERVMLSWTALEVLSPQNFLKPEYLAGGESRRIARFREQGLPWENGGEKSRPNYRLYYQVVLGTIEMEPAIKQLLTVYSDKRDERPPARGESILATVIVDRNGRPVDTEAVAVSSFAWG